MAKLTPEIKKFIDNSRILSNRILADRIMDVFQIKVSHQAVGNYKRKKHKEEVLANTTIKLAKEQKYPGYKKKPKVAITREKNVDIQEQKIAENANGYMQRIEAQKLLRAHFKTIQNRGTSKAELSKIAKLLVDSIYQQAYQRAKKELS